MKYPKIIFAIFLAALLLAACSPAQAPVQYSMGQSTSTGCLTPAAGKIETCKINGATDPAAVPTQTVEPQLDLTKSDTQGAVSVEVKPENLDKPGDALIFEVSMNNHSVDLGMDLTQLAVLTTDTGKTVQALEWVAPRGGHHVAGKLSFPATLDGRNLLDGASSFTITINNVDAPTRTFTWQLAG